MVGLSEGGVIFEFAKRRPCLPRIREIFLLLPTLSKLRRNHPLPTRLQFPRITLQYDHGIARSFLQLLPSAGLGSRQWASGPQHEIGQVNLCGMIVVSVARHADSSLYIQEKSLSWCCTCTISAPNSCQENLTSCL